MNPLETYLQDLYDIHSSGSGVKETSYHGTLANLFNAMPRGKIIEREYSTDERKAIERGAAIVQNERPDAAQPSQRVRA
ncbi:MAG: hypothetical protein QOH70_2427 [Blastocatellia bacterium]|jgi:hypothetical protein|nr:hypothetical protein [Blastocatellia bacterium]